MKNLKFVIVAAALAAGASCVAVADEAPKYIFYYIGDGMGMGPVVAAESYNRMVAGNSEPLTMMQMPVLGWCMTYSASSPVTDSAAAGTALSTGHKTRNGMLGMDADTVAVTSIARVLKDDGYGVGLVTTVAPDDATPGAFYAHVPHRSMYYEIGCQMAECGYDFVSGAGLRGLKDKDGKSTDLLDRFAANGVQIVHGPAGIADISADKVLLLNNEGTPEWNVGYTIDSIAGTLTLPMMVDACLKQLERTSPERFFIMVEGGNIDHALHANDGGAAIKETLNFDTALATAFDFYRRHPKETLIVVTADHDTGGLAMGTNFLGYDCRPGVFDWQKVSKEAFSDYCKGVLRSRMNYTWDDMKDYLSENLGLFTHVPVSAEQEAGLKARFDSTFEMRNSADEETLYANFNSFAVDVFRVLNDAAGIGFTTRHHSGNAVPVFAVGVGADEFKGFNNNIDLPMRIMRIAGKSF